MGLLQEKLAKYDLPQQLKAYIHTFVVSKVNRTQR